MSQKVLGLTVARNSQGDLCLITLFGAESAEFIEGHLLSDDDKTIEFVAFTGDGDKKSENIIAVMQALYNSFNLEAGTFPAVFDELLKTVFELGQRHPKVSG